MKTYNISEVLDKLEITYGELSSIKSLIEVTSSYCYNNDLNSSNDNFSNERNDYLNLLEIVKQKVVSLQNFNDDIVENIMRLQ